LTRDKIISYHMSGGANLTLQAGYVGLS